VGVEALLRWRHPERGLIMPGAFIPLAEESGLIIGLGTWVLQQACQQAARWQQQGRALRVAVNISALQVQQPDFVEQVLHALRVSQLDPSLLELELTESVMMHDREAITQRLQRLQQLGIRITIDDFGVGYSSLAYLQQFPVDCLKIDKAFIFNLLAEEEQAANAAALVQTIVALAHNFGLLITAEGIETQLQLRFLQHLGCHIGQGYLLGHPLPLSALEERLSEAEVG
jgi:EAL domain-containing protein (putative c-di-GMP-specific phosphodiesterase class I)